MKAVVTGGNRGIGLEISKKLLDKKFEVHVLSRTELNPAHPEIISWRTDISDFEQTSAVIDQIGPIDVLINNAGMMNTKTASDYDGDDILQILNVNLISSVRLSVHLAEQMAERGG